MKKFKFIADFEGEEKYLNQMAQKGLHLKKYNSLGVYTFKEGKPKNSSYRIDYRQFPNGAKFDEYCTLFEDAGWRHVYGTPRSGAQYFLPIPNKAQDGDIFSDTESRMGRYKRFATQSTISFIIMLAYFIIAIPKDFVFFDIRSLYYTEGLWGMTGSMFWKAFLFETPFVLIRVIPLLVVGYMATIYAYGAIKSKSLYTKNII
ncbi:MAG: DUF2812 domain-containing protein [Clostridiales bacterium]|jgi:hypothetical protein|nr:DUF2812 domain-containing protein [Clostridiales bacterium]